MMNVDRSRALQLGLSAQAIASTDQLRVRKNPPYRDVEREARRHLLAKAVLVGLYER
jgi:hypothetical protein